MALIKCPECGIEVSDKAKNCLKCNFPIDYYVVTAQKINISPQETIDKVKLIEGYLQNKKIMHNYICSSCGHVGSREAKDNFNLLIMLLLALFMILPAIIYAILSSRSKFYVCPKCKNQTMIPINSDSGRKLAMEIEPKVFEIIIAKTL